MLTDLRLVSNGRKWHINHINNAPDAGEATVIAELDLALARDKWVTSTNHRLADRRPEQYRM